MICNQFWESLSSWILKCCVWPVLFLFHLTDPHCLRCCCVTRGSKVLRVKALAVSSVHLRVGWAQRVALLLIQNWAQLRWFSHMRLSSFHYEGYNEQFLLMMVHLCIHAKLLSRVRLFVTPWTVAGQPPLSMGFSRQEYWSGVAMPSSRGSSWPRDPTSVSCISCIAGGFFTTEPLVKPINHNGKK